VTVRGLLACGIAILMGLGMVVLLFMPVLAQGGSPAGPSGPKGPTPTPTAKIPPTPIGPRFAAPAGVGFVAFDGSSYTARGTHPGEIITYTLAVSNTGNSPSLATEVKTHVPANTVYVLNSAHVQGGGVLSVNGGAINWTGVISDGKVVTITYRTRLPGVIGTVVSATATVYDPGAAAVVVLANRLTIQAPTGGPDAFGYTYNDSLAPSNPVAFSWVPTTTATRLNFGPFPNDDIVTGPVSIGFSFLFYTGTYTQTYVNTNGMVMFSPENANNNSNVPAPIPSLNGSRNYASCFFADLFQLDASQGVWVDHQGVMPNRTLVITFRTAYFVAPAAPPVLFQMILSEASNKIKCQYAQTPGPFQGSGAEAAIGLVGADGTAGLQYSFTTPYSPDVVIGPVEDRLAIEFARSPSPRPLYTASRMGVSYDVHPRDVASYTLAVRNTGTANGSATTVNNPIPLGMSFVPGSGHVLGGGVLTASGAGIHWTGSVTAGQSITITFRLTVPTTLGTFFTDTAFISDAQAATPVLVVNPYPMSVLPAPTGGPDTFGYTYKDSFAPSNPVTFSWIVTTSPASRLIFNGVISPDDEFTGPVPIGFAFTFYGHAYTQAFVGTNGLLTFITGTRANINDPIPFAGNVSNFAACFWDDLFENDASQGVWMETHGVAPNRYTVITYRTAYFEDETAPPAQFQMILYETSNQIKCQYLDMPGPIDASGGAGATVGLENADGTSGLQYFYRLQSLQAAIVGPLENGLAILFKPGSAAPSLSASTKAMTPLVHPGERVTYTVEAVNDGPVTGVPATIDDPIPPGATYVANSAQVSGGGSLSTNGSSVHWSGTLAPGEHVTVTFAVRLPAGGLVTNTATINAPQAILPVVRAAGTWVQPARGFGVGRPSYSYADSYAPGISYSWVLTTPASHQISSTLVGDNDDGFVSIPLGFTFPFFDGVYSSTFVSTNGLVMFNGYGSTAQRGQPIPTPGLVDNYASCFWADQIIPNSTGGGIWYETFGSQPNRYVVITFVLSDTQPSTAPFQYQMILFEKGALKCQYKQMSGSPLGDGRFATIGVEGRLGASGVQYFANPDRHFLFGPVENNLAILFEPLKTVFLPVIRK
jgi:uncharacterized repeat protein (TIGR01451 family)